MIEMKSSHAEVRGCIGVMLACRADEDEDDDRVSQLSDAAPSWCLACCRAAECPESSSAPLGLALFFGGWDATRPLVSGVPVMKTLSLSYPSHCLPLAMHFWQKGRSLVHYKIDQPVSVVDLDRPPCWRTFTRLRRQVSQPLYFPGTPTMIQGSMGELAIDVLLMLYRLEREGG